MLKWFSFLIFKKMYLTTNSKIHCVCAGESGCELREGVGSGPHTSSLSY